VKSDLNVADEDQPASSVTSISPTAFVGTPGTSIPNGTVVGNTHIVAWYAPTGDCESILNVFEIDETANFLDGAIKDETSNDISEAALGSTDVWPTRLESDLRVEELLDSGHPVLRRSVTVLVIDLPFPFDDITVPVNLLSFDVSDGNGFGSLTLQGTYNVAVVGDPTSETTAAMCTPMTSTGLLLGETAAGLTLLTCDEASGTHTMTTVLTREVEGSLVFDATVSDIVSCRAPIGGVAEFDPLELDVAAGGPGSSAPGTPLLAGLAVGGCLLLAGGAWYARRRWVS